MYDSLLLAMMNYHVSHFLVYRLLIKILFAPTFLASQPSIMKLVSFCTSILTLDSIEASYMVIY